ncbi:rCG20806 [Rattus norvegicus]|uniref:RCG20806 n=1 Tax=Rattus norvegicus TaxID=10116 RepID=A6JEH7_RAT|nr:rCG20806 [Rattus norvegicus]
MENFLPVRSRTEVCKDGLLEPAVHWPASLTEQKFSCFCFSPVA